MQSINKLISKTLVVFIFSLITISSFSFLPVVTLEAHAAEPVQYTPLSPLPGTTEAGCSGPLCKSDITTYLPGIFQLIIGLAAVVAVGRIIWGGIMYITTDSWQNKSEGKEMIKKAILGLLLIVSSWIIFATINPDLFKTGSLEINLTIGSDTITGGLPVGGAGGIGAAPTEPCPGCVAMIFPTNSISIANGSVNRFINPDTATKLSVLDAAFKSQTMTGTINEGYNPNGHQNVCHANGTCVDLNLPVENFTSIKTVIAQARGTGLMAIFEVKTQDAKTALVNQCSGNTQCITSMNAHILVETQITGPHFSVYNCSADPASCSTPFYQTALNIDKG